jgi:hypothetical protein
MLNGTRAGACMQAQEKLFSTPQPADFSRAKMQHLDFGLESLLFLYYYIYSSRYL